MAPPSNVDTQQLKLALDTILRPVEHLFIDRSRLAERIDIARGGFGSVWRAKLRLDPASPNFQIVAVKELLLVGDDEQGIKITKSFARELRVWSKVNHPNVLPLHGFFLDRGAKVALFITPFEPNGNLHQYLEREKPDTSRRLDLAIDTASGLLYLHSQEVPICHGDIKSLNVLVTGEGRAKLCDFGLAKIVEEHPSGLTTAGFENTNTIMYMSYELACVEGSRRSLKSDVWAWGGVALEIFTDQLPYERCQNGMQISAKLLQGDLPAPLDSLAISDRIRGLLQQCWTRNPTKRIPMSDCHGKLLEEKASLTEARPSSIQPLANIRERLGLCRLDLGMIDLPHSNSKKEAPGVVCRGVMRQPFRWAPSGTPVALETVLVRRESIEWSAELQAFEQRLQIWLALKHPNLLPFLGFNLDEDGGQLKWVSPWMYCGNIRDYIQLTKPSQARRIQLSSDAARGVLYLHTLKPVVVHGNLKSASVLIDSSGHAIISNFDLLMTYNDKGNEDQDESRVTVRWSSPELLEKSMRSCSSDMWAWACLLVEIFLECFPFHWIAAEIPIIRAIVAGTSPATIEELGLLPVELQTHVQHCWSRDPTRRPTIQEGILVLNNLLGNTHGLPVLESPSWSSAPDDISLSVPVPVQSSLLDPESPSHSAALEGTQLVKSTKSQRFFARVKAFSKKLRGRTSRQTS